MPDAGRSLGHTRPVSVNRQFSELLNSSIARSTWAKYNSGFNAFSEFEIKTGRKYSWPLSREVYGDHSSYGATTIRNFPPTQ
jgi:hypothetical protein